MKWLKKLFGFGWLWGNEILLSPSYLIKFIYEDGEDCVMCDNEVQKDEVVDRYKVKDVVRGIVVYKSEPEVLYTHKQYKKDYMLKYQNKSGVLDCVCRLKRVNGEWIRNEKRRAL